MGQLGDLSPQSSVAIGILVGLLSTAIQSLGLTLQRKSHLDEDAKDAVETRRPAYKRRKWQIGMFMFVISNLVGSTIQITTLPLPVLSTLQASGLVFNTAFATLLLHEPFTRYSIIGTVLTCGGAALIAAFGAIGEPAHSLTQLLHLLKQRDFIIWMVGTLILVVVTIVVAHLLKIWSSHQHIEQKFLKNERPRTLSNASKLPNGRRRSLTASLPQPLQLRVSRLRLFRGLSYALISGILSAHSLLVAKSAVELLVRTIIDHNNQFNRFESWLILIALLFFALSQLYYLHLGLRLCSTSVLYPFVFCVYNIIAILDGLIYFQQASRLSALHGGLIAVGTVILLGGVFALSWRLDDTPPEDAAHAAMPPPTPLTPGLGLVSSTSDDSERSPLLPTGRVRSSTASSRRSTDERTPLIYRQRARGATTSMLRAPTPERTRDIWAELDDEDDDEDSRDYLASLPRLTSPYLSQHNPNLKIQPRKRHADSVSSQAVSSSSRRSSDSASNKPDNLKSALVKHRDSSSSESGARRSVSAPNQRKRSASVRFADDKDASKSGHYTEQSHISRYDASVAEEHSSGQASRLGHEDKATGYGHETRTKKTSAQTKDDSISNRNDGNNKLDRSISDPG